MTFTVPIQTLGAGGDPLAHNYDYPILSLESGWAILTNHILMMLIVTVFMLWWMPRVARRVAAGKTGTSHDYVTKGTTAHMMEVICVFFRDQVARPALGDKTDKFIPYIWTVFFFILFNNLLGMVPLLDVTNLLLADAVNSMGGAHEEIIEADPHATDSHAADLDGAEHGETLELVEDEHAGHVGDADVDLGGEETDVAHVPGELADEHDQGAHGHEAHHAIHLGPFILFQDLTADGVASHFHGIGGTATGNIAVTFALALIAILVVIAAGIKDLGLGGFMHHLTLDAPKALWPLTIILEIIGLIAKPFALMVRLFANMTAGHVMLAALLGFSSMAWNGIAWTWTGVSWGVSVGGAIGAILIAIGSILFAVAIGLLELLVAFIQAYIFAFLTTMFISMFQHHGHEHDGKHTPDDAEMAITPQQEFTTTPTYA